MFPPDKISYSDVYAMEVGAKGRLMTGNFSYTSTTPASLDYTRFNYTQQVILNRGSNTTCFLAKVKHVNHAVSQLKT